MGNSEEKGKTFDISTYPEGYEWAKKELLDFLPEDEEQREKYMRAMLGFMVRA